MNSVYVSCEAVASVLFAPLHYPVSVPGLTIIEVSALTKIAGGVGWRAYVEMAGWKPESAK